MTHSDFNCIFVADQTDLRSPRIAGDDSSDEHESFVIRSI